MIFRKVALERLSSPEQLDQLMQVTDPRGWIALGALGLLLVAALAWGVAGSIPTTAGGEGILLRQGGVVELEALGGGQVEEILVAVGGTVERGQTVARIRQEALLRQIADAQARRADLADEHKDLLRFAADQMRLTERNLQQQRSNLERSIATLEQELSLLEERLAAEEGLLEQGLITKQEVLGTRQEINTARDQIAAQGLDLAGLELKRLEARQLLDQQIEAQQRELLELELDIRELEAQRAEAVTVVSPYSGRVLEHMVNPGDVVDTGTPVLSLEVLSEELQAVLFIPAAAGKKVQPGMAAQISPSTVKREEFGYILGRVTWVAEFPATSRGMRRLLANEDLVSRLMEQGSPIQVHVALARDPETPTGFDWSSTRGPEIEITSGTLAQGSIIIERDRPLSLVIPRIREKLGL